MSVFLVLLLAFFLSTVFCALFVRKLIPFLRVKKYGQNILEIGPSWHKSKTGTPTAGGIAFLITIPIFTLLSAFFLERDELPALLLALIYALLNGLIGMLDDFTKFKNKKNQGLLPWQKLFLQVLTAGIFLYLYAFFIYPIDQAELPFFRIPLDLGFAVYFLWLVLLVGNTNCANLTDGVDGLASSVAFIIGIHFSTEGILSQRPLLCALGVSLAGCMLGFLFFNVHPAKIFMGDTGSLFLGALIGAGAFLMQNPLTLILFCAVYVAEGISVILQVLIYKRTKKRLFLMAPLHHHLEKKGWSENKIVLAAVFITVLTSYFSHFA